MSWLFPIKVLFWWTVLALLVWSPFFVGGLMRQTPDARR